MGVLVGYGWLGAWIIDKITITAGQIGYFSLDFKLLRHET
jgi:hypothetical protein